MFVFTTMYNNRAKFALFSTFMVVTFIYFIWSKDKEIEDSGSIKVEHGKPDSRTNTEEMNAATMLNIDIVIYSLPPISTISRCFSCVFDPSLSVICNALKYTL